MTYYIFHRDAPGNPWGPFGSREIAADYRAMLLRYFHGPYRIEARS